MTALAAFLGTGALVSAAAPAALATEECADLPSCTTLAGPWVVVPPEPNVGALNQLTATWELSCPGDDFLIGSDWSGAGDPFLLTVWIVTTSGTRLYRDYTGVEWGAENDTLRPHSFQPLLGCSPTPPPVARAAGRKSSTAGTSRRVRRVTIKPLRPNRGHTFSFGCGPRERLVGSTHGIAFYQKRPPSVKEMRQLTATRTHRKGKVRVHVETGRRVGDDEQVRVQIHALCRRR